MSPKRDERCASMMTLARLECDVRPLEVRVAFAFGQVPASLILE